MQKKRFQLEVYLCLVTMIFSCRHISDSIKEKDEDSKDKVNQNKIEYGSFNWDSTVTDGNDSYFNVENTEIISESVLTGKILYFLGSSVTLGYASQSESFSDFIAKRNSCICVKDAVSGTTLRNNSKSSYIHRLKNSSVFDYSTKIDGFVVQLSTNDRYSVSYALGEMTGYYVTDLDSFDQQTIYGAIEYIIAYIKDIWDCPIFFYTGSKFRKLNNDDYAKMVTALNKVSEKWGITVIDMYSDVNFNSIVNDDIHNFIMSDDIHPKKVGYKLWWTPYIEYHLYEVLKDYY